MLRFSFHQSQAFGPGTVTSNDAREIDNRSKKFALLVETQLARSSPRWGSPIPADPSDRRQIVRVMVLIKATEDSESGKLPPTEAFEEMDKITEELVKAGVMIAGAGLKPSATSKRIAFEGASRTVIDGPFAETRELVAGFNIWEVRDMEEAVAWAKRFPNPGPGRTEIEIRPFYEVSDLAGVLPPEPADAAPRSVERTRLGVA